MSEYAPNIGPRQEFRSPLGTPQGVPGPLAAPAVEHAPLPDLGVPQQPMPVLQQHPVDTETDMLKTMIVYGRDYLDLPTVDETEKLEMHKAMVILQKLLADNQRLADVASGSSPHLRKLFA